MTAQLSREHVEEFISSIESDPVLRETRAFELKLAKHVLAGMSSEPVVSIGLLSVQKARPLNLSREMTEADDCDGCQHYRADICHGGKCAAPPAPVAVHDAYELIAEAWRLMDGQNPQTAEWHSAASRYLNAHGRAAMQAEPVSQRYTLPDEVRNALTLALQAMEFMGDTLNSLDAVCTEDVEQVTPAFDAVRMLLAAAPAAPEQEV